MEVTKKGLVIIGVITTAIIAVILFLTDMYITKLDEQARADMFNENVTMADADLFNTAPTELTDEQKDRLYALSETDSTDQDDLELAKRANAVIVQTMDKEEGEQFAEDWYQKHSYDVGDPQFTTQVEVDTTPEIDEAVAEPVEATADTTSLTKEDLSGDLYLSLSDSLYHMASSENTTFTKEDLISNYGFTEEDLANIPER